jgi:pimeloyl-ACP methyl ester carboxylesterase
MHHRLEYAGDQVTSLLDHLGIDRAVVGGMSLGANVAVETAAKHPERVQAMVCEMPVLERGTIAVVAALAPLLFLFRYAPRPVRAVFGLAGRMPRTGHEALDAILDTGSDPRAMAAIMHGYTSGPVCTAAHERQQIQAPALVIGHRHDWLHPLSDAQALVRELPDARFADARHIFEMRSRPERLCGEVADFLDEVWQR